VPWLRPGLFLVLITALKDTLILGQSYRESDTSIGLVKELGNLLFSKYIVAFENDVYPIYCRYGRGNLTCQARKTNY